MCRGLGFRRLGLRVLLSSLEHTQRAPYTLVGEYTLNDTRTPKVTQGKSWEYTLNDTRTPKMIQGKSLAKGYWTPWVGLSYPLGNTAPLHCQAS